MKLKNKSNLDELNQDCNAINPKTNGPRRKPQDGIIRWLSAMHAIYDSDKNNVGQRLGSIHRNFDPHIGFLTTHCSSKALLSTISPFPEVAYKIELKRDIGFQFSGIAEEVTKWRSNLMSDIVESDYPYPINTSFIMDYLNRDVSWVSQVNKAYIHIYHKRQQ